jgi:hypothetical protein
MLGVERVLPIHAQFSILTGNEIRNWDYQILMITMFIHPGNQGTMMALSLWNLVCPPGTGDF